MDPNTGLIYFKYDFGYEFGILFPGEGHKFIAGTGNAGSNHERAKSVPPRNRHSSAGDIRIPVLHERTTRPTTTPASSYYDRPASGGYASESDLSPHANGPGRGKRIVHEINIDALHGSPVHPGSGRRSVPSVQSGVQTSAIIMAFDVLHLNTRDLRISYTYHIVLCFGRARLSIIECNSFVWLTICISVFLCAVCVVCFVFIPRAHLTAPISYPFMLHAQSLM